MNQGHLFLIRYLVCMDQNNFTFGGMSQPISVNFQINFITASSVKVYGGGDAKLKKICKHEAE